jgi:nicotinamide mononucleotide adenylyltransferase
MFEMARDYFKSSKEYDLIGAYFSPVSDAYAKPGLADGAHRVNMCELAVAKSDWIMVDPWETLQSKYIPTAKVLDHFYFELNQTYGGWKRPDGNSFS